MIVSAILPNTKEHLTTDSTMFSNATATSLVHVEDPAGGNTIPSCSTEIAIEDAVVILVHEGDPAGNSFPLWSAQIAVVDAATSPVSVEDHASSSIVQTESAVIADIRPVGAALCSSPVPA